jgi:DNA-binding LacI/PurR family transcriptional regulator
VATRADVAKLAGVSTSTVSYALSGARPISEATRLRIEAAMGQLGYTPNALASGLAGRRSRIIALLFPAGPRVIASTDMEYVIAAADAARERGYHLVVWTTSGSDLEEVRRLRGTGLVDGVLLMEVLLQDERVRFLQDGDVPLALIGRTADFKALAYADADFDRTAELAVEYLARLGHRDIGLLNAPSRLLDIGSGACTRVAQSVATAIDRAGLSLVTLPCEHSAPAGRKAFEDFFRRSPEMTGVISFNWEATVGLMQQAQKRGVAIPEQLSVVSLANSTGMVEITIPALTTISPPGPEIGRAAALALIDRLEHPEAAPAQLLVMGPLVERGSSGPAPRSEAVGLFAARASRAHKPSLSAQRRSP